MFLLVRPFKIFVGLEEENFELGKSLFKRLYLGYIINKL